MQARFRASQVEVVGEASEFERRGDSGQSIRFSFCARCGTTLFWRMEGTPEDVAVAVGAFADPEFPPPTASVYEARQHAWVDVATSGWGRFD